MHVFLKLLSVVFYALLIIIGFFTISSNTKLFGHYLSFLVRSGSMEPTIIAGDIILIKNNPPYKKNDVVTFRDQTNRIVTHRIIQVAGNESTPMYLTKGDANRSIDSGKVSLENILGKVVLVIPKIGFLVNFTKSMPGLIIMILSPVLLLIFDQLYKINKR